MPAMPRIRGRAMKIAFEVLGTPSNYREKKTKLQKRIDERLMYENTQRVR
jgi:hypothetical protein